MSHRGRKRNIQHISTGRNPPPSNQPGAGGASTSASIANLLRNVNDPVTERASSLPENASEYNLRNRTRSQNSAATTTTSTTTTPAPSDAASNATSGDSKTEEQPQCGICLDNITIQGVLNSCQHLFCFECIDQWSKTSNTCPLCKRRFKELTKKDLSTPTKKAKKVKVKHTERRGRPDPDDDSYIDLEFLLSVLAPPPHIMLSGLFPMLPRLSLFDRFLQSMQVPLFLLDGPGSGPLVDLTQEVIDLTNESDNEDDDDVVVTSAPPQVNSNNNRNNSTPPAIPVDPVDDDLEDFGNIPFLPEPRPASRRSSRRTAPQATTSTTTGNTTTTTTTTTFAFTLLPSMQQQPSLLSDPFRRMDPMWPMQLPHPQPNFPLQFHPYSRQPYTPAPPPPPTQPQNPAQPDARNRRGCPFNFHPHQL